ncbi:unnamed protein product [Pipistrellus nathusii]|uniref:Uncharacterized protein n=1 Tax=Pipistrellus nathusii TaxID=59473 RepID=A0ABN9ZDP7_PIPNA
MYFFPERPGVRSGSCRGVPALLSGPAHSFLVQEVTHPQPGPVPPPPSGEARACTRGRSPGSLPCEPPPASSAKSLPEPSGDGLFQSDQGAREASRAGEAPADGWFRSSLPQQGKSELRRASLVLVG